MRKLEEIWFRYFSYSTLEDDRYNWVRYVVAMIMMIPFMIGVVLDVLGRNGLPAIIVFLVIMIVFSIFWISVWFYHNWRIKH